MTQRLVKHPFLAIFDGPDTNVSTDAPRRSTVPLQALYLLNNPFVQEQAAGLAGRLIAASATTDAPDRRWAYELAWARPPAAEERRARASRFCELPTQRSPSASSAADLGARSLDRAWPRSC